MLHYELKVYNSLVNMEDDVDSYQFHSDGSLISAVNGALRLSAKLPEFKVRIECPDGEVLDYLDNCVPSTPEVKNMLFKHYTNGNFEYLLCVADSGGWACRLRCPVETSNAMVDLYTTIKHFKNELPDVHEYALYRGKNKVAERSKEEHIDTTQRQLQQQLADFLQAIDVQSLTDFGILSVAPSVALLWLPLVNLAYNGTCGNIFDMESTQRYDAVSYMQCLSTKVLGIRYSEVSVNELIQRVFCSEHSRQVLLDTIKVDDTCCFSFLDTFLYHITSMFERKE